jgi:hypothetical protein
MRSQRLLCVLLPTLAIQTSAFAESTSIDMAKVDSAGGLSWFT